MGAHVLVVEDNTLVVDAMRLLLEESGFRVSTATTVREAVDSVRRDPPDVMLLDLSLRDDDGLAVLAALGPGGEAPRVTVALTGHDEPEVRARCLAAGCRDVLLKPVNPMELPRYIARWIEESARTPARDE